MKKAFSFLAILALLLFTFGCGKNSSGGSGSKKVHDVFFLDGNNQIAHLEVKDGEIPKIDDPVKEAEDGVYEFVGWAPDLCPTYVDTTYYACFNYKPNIYHIYYDTDGGELSEYATTEYSYHTNGFFTLTDATKIGYVFDGWYQDGVRIDSIDFSDKKDYHLKAKWEIGTYEIYAITESNKGTVTGEGEYEYLEEVTLTATPTSYYVFDGWYLNGEKVSDKLEYTFKCPGFHAAYYAKWALSPQKITIDNRVSGLKINGVTSGNNYNGGTTVRITTEDCPSGKSLKWIRSDGEVYIGRNYSFVMPYEDITIEVEEQTVYSSPTNSHSVYMGSYPQSEVTNADLKTWLTNQTTDSDWKAYKYYNAYNAMGTNTVFMYYCDIDLDKDGTYEYRGIKFDQYRNKESYHNQSSPAYQQANGYIAGNVYWFLYERIRWNILEENNGIATVISEDILDSQYFNIFPNQYSYYAKGSNGYGNNYDTSDIRMWLMKEFYEKVFNNGEKDIILKTEVDNSKETTDSCPDDYLCKNTFDKVYLLSYKEALDYGTQSAYSSYTRKTSGTDYAKAQGLYVADNGNSYWWTRSPILDKYNISCIDPDCGFTYDEVSFITNGVRPVMRIELEQ